MEWEIDESMVLANIFYAAISIYLSGVYDYELHFWDKHAYTVPTLGDNEIQSNAKGIVSNVTDALKHTTISPLLFLFPLRIAGARARCGVQRRLISEALALISTRFVVATSISLDLERVWTEIK